MKTKTLLIVAIFLINIGCDNQETSSETTTEVPVDTSDLTISSNSKEVTAIQVVQVTYENAIVYGASTDYYFKNETTGEIIQFRNSNLEEEATVKMPNNMLQESEDGPPEANKALIGKVFMLSSIDDVITEVELEENYDYDED